MAYVSKQPSGTYRCEVDKLGIRKTKAGFKSKRAAQEWGAAVEQEILDGKTGKYPKKSLGDAVDRYIEEVTPKKEGSRWETLRLRMYQRLFPTEMALVFHEIRQDTIAHMRDTRLKTVSKGTVDREMTIIRNVFTIGRKEWLWCGESPFRDVSLPGQNPPSNHVWKWREIRQICRRLGYVTGDVQTKYQELALAFLVSLRIAMRAQEVLSLSDENVDFDRRVATVKHKMQYRTHRPRVIPLTPPALRLLGYVRGRGAYFTISEPVRDAVFRKIKGELLIDKGTFHDARGTALTLLSRKVDVLTLSRISGISNLKLLLETYYRETPEQVATRLSSALRPTSGSRTVSSAEYAG